MRVLLIKTSSLGDIIHTFPAITDAVRHHPTLTFDWITEEDFSQIPLLHPAVKRVFPVALRRWRKTWWQPTTLKEIKQALSALRLEEYDIVLDAQGLLKSSLLSLFTHGKRYGYGWHGAREALASLFYHQKFDIPWTITSVNRARTLFARTFDYPVPIGPTDAGLTFDSTHRSNKILFLPGASWATKKWPIDYWIELARRVKELGAQVTVPWSSPAEYQEALRIQSAGNHVHVLDKMSLGELADTVATHQATVAVDSGLGYLSAAFQIPTIIVWGPTTPKMIGKFDIFQHNITSALACSPCVKRNCQNKHLSEIQPPCFAEITPDIVFQKLIKELGHRTK